MMRMPGIKVVVGGEAISRSEPRALILSPAKLKPSALEWLSLPGGAHDSPVCFPQ
jgi:hypothetical protein